MADLDLTSRMLITITINITITITTPSRTPLALTYSPFPQLHSYPTAP
jgi:hypothetical protein